MTQQTIRIAIVDDNYADARLLVRYTEDLGGWTVETAICATGDEAVEEAARADTDLFFVDYMLGAETGFDVIRRLQEAKSKGDFVILTGQGDEQIAAEAMRHGALDYLTKDQLSPETLERTLRYVYERRKARKELEQAYQDLERRVDERTAELQAEVAERRRAETELRKLTRAVEQSPNIVIVTDESGSIEYVNPKFTEITGYGADEAIGQRPNILKSARTPRTVHEDLWSTITEGHEWRGELLDQRRDGSTFWVSASISPLKNSSGVTTHYVAMEEDITQRKVAEIELRSAKDQAEVANRAKSELLANMSHELRTPLNAIIGFSSAMMEELLGPLGNEKYKDYIQDIHASGEHLLDIINDILDVSAIEAGKLELHEHAVRLPKVVESSLRLVKSRAHANQVLLETDLDPGLPEFVADERRLKQILLNLLTNAVKFTPEGGSVRLSAQVTLAGELEIAVTDTGIGMDEEGIQRALSPFGQIDSSLSRRYEGTGLGLPLTIGLVELHGGRLAIKSTPGQGTRVTVTLPGDRLEAA